MRSIDCAFVSSRANSCALTTVSCALTTVSCAPCPFRARYARFGILSGLVV